MTTNSVAVTLALAGVAFIVMIGLPGLVQATDRGIPILLYHRFDPTTPGSMTVTTPAFEEQLRWLADHKVLTEVQVSECYAAHTADIFRTVRFGLEEAHSRGEIMQFNYMVAQQAISQDPSGMFVIDFVRMPQAVASLARELLEMEAGGDRARAEEWFEKYAVMPPNLERALEKVADVPVDINPTFTFQEKIG